MQRFPRQTNEDGPNPSAHWGKDLAIADAEDPDDEDHMPILDVGTVPVLGKTRAYSLRDWSDDDESEFLEVLNSCSAVLLYPVSSTSADSGDQVHDVPPLAVGGPAQPPRKRAASESTEAGPSKKKSKKKVVVSKHRQRPTTFA